jgi:hypothetical protein
MFFTSSISSLGQAENNDRLDFCSFSLCLGVKGYSMPGTCKQPYKQSGTGYNFLYDDYGQKLV